MLFGLTNVPAIFQRIIDEVIGELNLEAGRNYLDDIIIGLKTFEKHLKDLEKVFMQLKKAELKIKPTKCHFAKNIVTYLDHQLKAEKVKPNSIKVEAINNMKMPVDISGIQRFLELTSYYRRFIKKYSQIVELLNVRLQKNNIVKWGPKCQKIFEKLKKRLIIALILAYLNFQKLFSIYYNAQILD
jgi:hypothetical protein